VAEVIEVVRDILRVARSDSESQVPVVDVSCSVVEDGDGDGGEVIVAAVATLLSVILPKVAVCVVLKVVFNIVSVAATWSDRGGNKKVAV
jgi:hypothetical protein